MVIAPPLVEYDGNTDCIVDGIHRIYSAKEKGKRITVLYVSGADRPIIGKPIDRDLSVLGSRGRRPSHGQAA